MKMVLNVWANISFILSHSSVKSNRNVKKTACYCAAAYGAMRQLPWFEKDYTRLAQILSGIYIEMQLCYNPADSIISMESKEWHRQSVLRI